MTMIMIMMIIIMLIAILLSTTTTIMIILLIIYTYYLSYVKVRPVHLLRVFLLRVLESNFPGDPLSNSTDMRIPTP